MSDNFSCESLEYLSSAELLFELVETVESLLSDFSVLLLSAPTLGIFSVLLEGDLVKVFCFTGGLGRSTTFSSDCGGFCCVLVSCFGLAPVG